MERSSRIALVSHCLVNANARVAGLASWRGVHPVVAELAERGYGVVQLECPEVAAEGVAREPRPLEYYDTPGFVGRCERIAEQTTELVAAYAEAGCRVVLYVGVDGSPTCGVSVTNVTDPERREHTRRVPGCGVLARALRQRLGAEVAFVAIDGRDKDLGVGRVVRALEVSDE